MRVFVFLFITGSTLVMASDQTEDNCTTCDFEIASEILSEKLIKIKAKEHGVKSLGYVGGVLLPSEGKFDFKKIELAPFVGMGGGGIGLHAGSGVWHPQEPEQKGNLIINAVKKATALMPDDNLERGLSRYFGVLNYESYEGDSSVGSGNEGITGYMASSFSDNSCFRDLAIKFYGNLEVKSELVVQPDIFHGLTLNDKVGQPPFEKFQPGWLWQEAMKYGAGNPNLAMTLIGLCGHDDLAQDARLRIPSDDPSAIAEKNAKIKKLQEVIEEWRKAVLNENDTVERKRYEIKYARYSRILAKVKREPPYIRVNCPDKDSVFYTPQSLDKEADVSQATKDKVAKIQHPNDGAVAAPAKHYHVYGGAFMACQLRMEGVSPTTTATIEKEAARFYRSLRLCDKVDSIQSMQEILAAFATKVEKPQAARGRDNSNSRPVDSIAETIDYCEKNYSKSDCINFFQAQGLPSPSEIPPKMWKSKASIMVSEYDAITLYDKWFLGGKVLGTKIPCTNIQLSGPDLDKSVLLSNINHIDTCRGIVTSSRCRAAINRLKTYLVDFDWTMEQHENGAKFAAKHCKPGDSHKDIMDSACTALANTRATVDGAPAKTTNEAK